MKDLYKFLDYSYMMERKNEAKKEFLQSNEIQEKKIAVLCGSTFGQIKEFLEIFLLYHKIKPVFYIGEYNRYFEEAVFPNKNLDAFAPDIIFIHMTNKNLLWHHNFRAIQEDKQRLEQIWKDLEEKYHCIIIQNNFEYFSYRIIGNAARTYLDGNIRYIDNINQFISDYKNEHENFYLNDINYLSSYVGLQKWNDERLWSMYKYPFAVSEMPRYALNVANIIKSILGKNRKTIITDLDNTLWGGEIGEIGINNIKLGNETPQGELFGIVHNYLKYLSFHGIILNICSKNEYITGIDGIRSEKSILKEENFTLKKINWNSKAQNIKDILNELNLLDSAAVFMDDNIFECDSVSSLLPDIEVVQMTDVKKFLEEMDALSFFEIAQTTQEDLSRNQYYKGNLARNEAKREFENYDEYLKALNMVCYVDRICDDNIGRVVQLMNKTNQFNFLTQRYTLEEMKEVVQKPEIETFALELHDKFGSNGIVSIAILYLDREEAHIVGWVMSCRVFERNLEFTMLRLVCETCLKRNISLLHGYYRRTIKNEKIASFFGDLGFEKIKTDTDNGGTQEWICKDIKNLLKKCGMHNIMIKYK